MFRPVTLATCLLVAVTQASAQDAIPAETVAAVKKATVFVRVESGTMKGSGSGFVVSADKGTLLVATNYHVVTPLEREKRLRQIPADVATSLKAANVTVVFDGGSATELSVKAEAIVADPEAGLAILRITDLKDMKVTPKPIEYATSPDPYETLTVYTFGFPFGQALATGKGAPAITVGKGSVSSLRFNDKDELSLVQLDVALNPGNSGGPVVDQKGRLVGVAVASVKNGQGIGFAVPAAELAKILKGRMGLFRLTGARAADGKMTVRTQIGVIDPVGGLRSITVHYLVVPKGKKLDSKESVEKQPGSRKTTLKIDNGIASGEFLLDTTEGELIVQAVPEGGAGGAASGVRAYGLAVPKGASGAVTLMAPGVLPSGVGAGEAPPPAGWKEYTAGNKSFKIWVPDKTTPTERQRIGLKSGYRLNIDATRGDVPSGPSYVVEHVTIPPPPPVVYGRIELLRVLRDVVVNDGADAKLVSEVDTRLGKYPGTEYVVERGEVVTRTRGFVAFGTIYLVRVIGTAEQVASAESTQFLDSCRLQLAHLPGNLRGPRIQGGGEVEFRDYGPRDSLLIGLEVGLGKWFDFDSVVAVRPIYRVGDKEVLGEQYGTNTTRVVRLVAKPEYAIGAIVVRTVVGLDGLSVVFMRVDDDQLDIEDKYESEWVGTRDKGGVKIGGDGTPIIGLVGRTNTRDVTALGLGYFGEKPWPVARPTKIVGGGEREHREITPDGGLLVGLEIGTTRHSNNDIVRAIRPVYRVGEKEALGEQYGTDTARVVKLVAKPGYAVGAILVKPGWGTDGLSVIFMKVTDGKLDPRDNYESEWVGLKGDEGLTRISGEGTLVLGIATRGNAKESTGLGLLLKPVDKK